MGAGRIQNAQNILQYRLSFLKYLVVPVSKNTKPYRSESAFPIDIVAKTIEVLSTIELNHKLCLKTREIGNIAADRDLATKPKTRKLAPPQMSPEVLLSVRRLISKFARAAL